ncbi:MAG: peptidylprolyl isomerase [Rhodospirillaceae bacterium]|nr:peptidylprolyl isomerase [Rhodospirillaceae bacterium]
MRLRAAFVLLLLVPFIFGGTPVRAAEADPENTLYLDLTYGRVVIHMRPDLAPKHVERVKHLTRGGFYDGLPFHRVISGFMAQTGDPLGDGTGGSGRMLQAEFTKTPGVRGVVAMARTDKKDSADSQFFIVLADSRSALDGKYTVWGEVTSGMEYVDMIKKGDSGKNGAVKEPDRIVRLQVAADEGRAADATAAPALLTAPGAGNTARNFSGVEFRCGALATGATVQPVLARSWAHGYLVGYYKALDKLKFSDTASAGFDADVSGACAAYGNALLITVTSQALTKSLRDMPPSTAAFAPGTYVCRNYTAAQSAKSDEAAFADLWVMAFIQGYKNAGQPGLEIPFDARPQILAAVGTACARNPDTGFVDLVAAFANKMKLK